jgi:hypothetical protein
LLDWLNGHPLSLRLLLPQLETVSAAGLLDALKGNTANLPPGFVGEGRLASLGASLKYSFDHLAPEMRDRLPALALFEGVADEQLLAFFSSVEDVPARFAGVPKEAWSATLQQLAGIGLLTSLGGGMYGLHPALPFYLMAEWRRMAGEGFASKHGAAEHALLTAYAAFGIWLLEQIQGGAADAAFSLIGRQRRTIGRLLGFALSAKRYTNAQELMQPLNEFWKVRGWRRRRGDGSIAAARSWRRLTAPRPISTARQAHSGCSRLAPRRTAPFWRDISTPPTRSTISFGSALKPPAQQRGIGLSPWLQPARHGGPTSG